MKKFNFFTSLLFLTISYSSAFSQASFNADTVRAGLYDNGKMWTFDIPPTDYFFKTYGFKPDAKWFEKAQKAALRFATYCSASFVSNTGLIMTNHHCARESGTAVQHPGESFDKNGFYAQTQADERKVPGLFVDQLVKIVDITREVKAFLLRAPSEDKKMAFRDSIFSNLKKVYANKVDWKGLEIQPITFYNGGKYSLYGFKRYKDIRLVFMPEGQVAYFGGDPDNFTYPRYNLDCSFFRAYDESGKPAATKDYFPLNKNGAAEGEPVFVIGNPGRTQRLSTQSDLKYNRETYLPSILKWLRMQSATFTLYNEKAKNDSLQNEIFSLNNSIKALSGQLSGLQDAYVVARKNAFEKDFINKVKNKLDSRQNVNLWDSIASANDRRKLIFPTLMTYRPISNILDVASQIARYAITKQPAKADLISQISKLPLNRDLDRLMIATQLEFFKSVNGDNDSSLSMFSGKQSNDEIAAYLVKTTHLYDRAFISALISKGDSAIRASKDPLIQFALKLTSQSITVQKRYQQINASIFSYKSSLGKLMFEIYGTAIPPDATFSLRINDGKVKGYSYNGTVAPYKTTFYGMYDRYYSFDKRFPFSLPEHWTQPTDELLRAPLDFATTNDIIGGNSGSAIINEKEEAVGLVFDGNIESLPGAYIYLDESNRTIAVHPAGIEAALRIIFKASRLHKELFRKE